MLHSIADKSVSMFDIGANVLINPVNCIGIMGGGLALKFKTDYPEMFNDYKALCDTGLFRPGMIHTFPVRPDLYIFNLPTKDDLSDSTMKIVKTSLAGLLVTLVAARPWLSGAVIAMPALGCGLGNLSWEGEGGVKDELVKFANDPRLVNYHFVLFEPK